MVPHVTDVDALSYGRLIGLDTKHAAPPTNTYIGPNDLLATYIASSLTSQKLIINARILMPDGNIVPNQWNYVSAGGRIGSVNFQYIPEGFLLSLCVENDSTVGPGTTFVRVSLVRGNPPSDITITQVLMQGYTSLANVLSWPPSVLTPSTSGRGNVRHILGTTPGPGVDITEVVPAYAMWRLYAFNYQLATSAAAGARTSFLVIDDGVNLVEYLAPPAVATAAGAVVNYSYGNGQAISANAGICTAPLNSEIYLIAGYRIRTITTGIQAGDQMSLVSYLVEEWLNI